MIEKGDTIKKRLSEVTELLSQPEVLQDVKKSKELGKELGSEIKAEFSKKLQGDFCIGPKDGSYFTSLSDQTFDSLICEYLRPVTKKLLFGE